MSLSTNYTMSIKRSQILYAAGVRESLAATRNGTVAEIEGALAQEDALFKGMKNTMTQHATTQAGADADSIKNVLEAKAEAALEYARKVDEVNAAETDVLATKAEFDEAMKKLALVRAKLGAKPTPSLEY
jgi:hypothetical protein